ncbi:MAG: YchF/TatD family DNA exonuclease [Gammaproteobacteria bacterium]
MTPLIDIGVNLAHDSFDADRDEVILRAAEVGVTRMIITGTSVTASARAAELASSRPGLYATAGIHPHHASELDEHSIDALESLAAQPRVVAIGECGLDFFRNFSPPDAQERAFAAQLELAAKVELPVFLHQRDAHERFTEIVAAYRDRLVGGVAHCFTGGPEELEAYLDLGLYIGVTGWVCDERRGAALREALPHIPLDRLLIETDAPYLLPRDLEPKPRSRRNEPAFLPHVLEHVAKGLGVSAEEAARASTANAETLFRLPPEESLLSV